VRAQNLHDGESMENPVKDAVKRLSIPFFQESVKFQFTTKKKAFPKPSF